MSQETYSHHAAHQALHAGDSVTAHWIFGHHTSPSVHSARATVHLVTQDHVLVRLEEDVPAAGEFPGAAAQTTLWAIPHECWHPHPRVEVL